MSKSDKGDVAIAPHLDQTGPNPVAGTSTPQVCPFPTLITLNQLILGGFQPRWFPLTVSRKCLCSPHQPGIFSSPPSYMIAAFLPRLSDRWQNSHKYTWRVVDHLQTSCHFVTFSKHMHSKRMAISKAVELRYKPAFAVESYVRFDVSDLDE